MISDRCKRKYNLDVITLDTIQAVEKTTAKTAMEKNLFKVKNYDTKIIQGRIILVAYFHSKQVFPAPDATKMHRRFLNY